MIILGVDGGGVVSRASFAALLFQTLPTPPPTRTSNLSCVAECHGVCADARHAKSKKKYTRVCDWKVCGGPVTQVRLGDEMMTI
jgi:hypothetical protein